EPPPKATTPSCLPARRTAMPDSTLDSTGFDCTSANSATVSPADFNKSIACVVIGNFARPASVTSRGREMPAARHASASSLIRPAPKRTGGGKVQIGVEWLLLQ